MLGPIPRIVEYPGRLIAGECAKTAHPDLIHEPVEWRPRRGRMIFPLAKLVLVSDCIHQRIQPIYIGSDSRRSVFYARINLRNYRNLRIRRGRISPYISQEIVDGFDSKFDPLPESRIVGIAELDIFACIQARLFA